MIWSTLWHPIISDLLPKTHCTSVSVQLHTRHISFLSKRHPRCNMLPGVTPLQDSALALDHCMLILKPWCKLPWAPVFATVFTSCNTGPILNIVMSCHYLKLYPDALGHIYKSLFVVIQWNIWIFDQFPAGIHLDSVSRQIYSKGIGIYSFWVFYGRGT